MRERLSAIGWWFFAAIVFGVVAALLSLGIKAIEGIKQWILLGSVICLITFVPVSLVLLIPKKSRVWGGTGIWLSSWPLGLALWIDCLLYAFSVSAIWALAGLCLGGIGIVPIAAIMALVRGDWTNLGNLVVTCVIVMLLRYAGLWIMSRAEEQEILDRLAAEEPTSNPEL